MVRKAENVQQATQLVEGVLHDMTGVYKTRKFKYISEKRQHSELGQLLEQALKDIALALKNRQGHTREQVCDKITQLVLPMAGLQHKESIAAVLKLEGQTGWKWLLLIKRQLHMALLEEERRVRKDMIKMGRIRAECGEFYMPWAKHTYARGKMWKRPEVGILALKNPAGHMVTGSLSGEIMLDFMKQQWSQVPEGSRMEFSFHKKAPEDKIRDILNKDITAKEVQVQAEALKLNKAPGTDLIPNEVWMRWSVEGYEALAQLFQEVFNGQEHMPTDCKKVVIKWIYKNGDPFLMQNYRPIALGNTLSKLYMRILNSRLEELVEETGIVSEVQQGFRSDRSCAEAVIVMQLLAAQKNRDH